MFDEIGVSHDDFDLIKQYQEKLRREEAQNATTTVE